MKWLTKTFFLFIILFIGFFGFEFSWGASPDFNVNFFCVSEQTLDGLSAQSEIELFVDKIVSRETPIKVELLGNGWVFFPFSVFPQPHFQTIGVDSPSLKGLEIISRVSGMATYYPHTKCPKNEDYCGARIEMNVFDGPFDHTSPPLTPYLRIRMDSKDHKFALSKGILSVLRMPNVDGYPKFDLGNFEVFCSMKRRK